MSNLTIKPKILVYSSQGSDEIDLQEVLYGIEEEQIPFAVEYKEFSTAVEAAYQAAQDSSLNVGIGFVANELAFHYKNLPAKQPYQKIERVGVCPQEILKHFGANAARLVKRSPLFNLEE